MAQTEHEGALADVKIDWTSDPDPARAQALRALLPAQRLAAAVHEVTARAVAEFGLLWTRQEINARVGQTLPRAGQWPLGVRVALPLLTGLGLVAFLLGSYAPLLSRSVATASMFLVVGLLFHGACEFRTRSARWVPLAAYVDPIPDSALLRWDAARASTLFREFYVVSPQYGLQGLEWGAPRGAGHRDPWLIGLLARPGDLLPDPAVGAREVMARLNLVAFDDPRFIVLAYWD
jgi:hypothetical protein